MTEFLNHGMYKHKLEKEKILAKLGPELTADLFVNTSWRDHPPGCRQHSIENELPGETTPRRGAKSSLHRRHRRRRADAAQNACSTEDIASQLAAHSSGYGILSERRNSSRLQQLGRLGRAHRVRKAAAVERHAS